MEERKGIKRCDKEGEWVTQERHICITSRELVSEMTSKKVEAVDIGKEFGGQDERGGNKREALEGIPNNGVDEEGVATVRVSSEVIKEVGPVGRLLGERMKVDLTSHIKDNGGLLCKS